MIYAGKNDREGFVMKKVLLLFAALVLVCTSSSTYAASRSLLITPADAIDMSGMSLYCQSDSIYFAADDSAKVSLYVQAGKNDDGEFMLDDGQDWLLIMETSFGNYPLFPREYVQLGMVDYIVFNEYGDNTHDTFHILVTVKMSASYEIYDCIYVDDEKAFRAEPVYTAMNINPVGSSR